MTIKNLKVFACFLVLVLSTTGRAADVGATYSVRCNTCAGSGGTGQDLFSRMSGFTVVYDSQSSSSGGYRDVSGTREEQLDNEVRVLSNGKAYLVIDPTIDPNLWGYTERLPDGTLRIAIRDIG